MPDDQLYLPERFDGTTVTHVKEALLARQGQPTELDAGRVKSTGALGLQVLISARLQWLADQAAFRVVNPSDAVLSACHTLGIKRADLGLSLHEGADA